MVAGIARDSREARFLIPFRRGFDDGRERWGELARRTCERVMGTGAYAAASIFRVGVSNIYVDLPGQRLQYLQSFGAAAENGRDERASLSMGRWPPKPKLAAYDEAIERAGATLRYLPAYSPDFNPIETSFRKAQSSSSQSGRTNI